MYFSFNENVAECHTDPPWSHKFISSSVTQFQQKLYGLYGYISFTELECMTGTAVQNTLSVFLALSYKKQ